MQLMVDINVETPASLRLCAQFLLDSAALRESMEKTPATAPLAPPAPAFTPVVPVVPSAGDFDPNDLARAQQEMNTPGNRDPRDNPLRGHSDATPFVPPAPSAPAVPPVSNISIFPTLPSNTNGLDEFDSSGVPFDSRIHQKNKNKKKDGSWKLQKNIAEAVVSAVMQELAPRIRAPMPASATHAPAAPPAPIAPSVPNPADLFGHTPLPAGAIAPVSPPAPPAPQASAAPQTQTAPQAPQAPGAQTQNQAQGQNQSPTPLDSFRALVRKITAARSENLISQDEVNQCVASVGAPTLHLLGSMPHLVPHVEAVIDALLMSRR